MGEEARVRVSGRVDKELRRLAEEIFAGVDAPESRLVAKSVRVMRGDEQKIIIQAVNAEKSVRGVYRRLKEMYKKDPSSIDKIRSMVSYKKVLGANVVAERSPFGDNNET